MCIRDRICAAYHAGTRPDDQVLTAALYLLLMLTWLLGNLNSDLLIKLAPRYSARPRPVGLQPGPPNSDTSVGIRKTLNRYRIGGWVVQDIEFLTLAIVIGPALGRPLEGAALAFALMLLQKSAHTIGYWYRRRGELAQS